VRHNGCGLTVIFKKESLMRKFGNLVTTVLIAAGTGWIAFGQPTYLHAQEAQAEIKIDRDAASKGPALDSKHDQATARRLLAQATKAAVGPNSIQGLSDLFLSSDRDRIRGANVSTTELDATTEQLRNDWKAKYGSDLNIANPEVALDYSKGRDQLPGANSGPRNASGGADNRAGARIDPSPMTDSTLRRSDPEVGATATAARNDADAKAEARVETETKVTTETNANANNVNATAGGKPGEIRVNAQDQGADVTAQGPAVTGPQRMADTPRNDANNVDAAQTAGARVETNTNTNSADATAKVDMNSDRVEMRADKGISYWIPASHGNRAAFVSLAPEGDTMKINLDDNVDANELVANLNQQLRKVSDNKANWPSDVNEASRLLAHHVAVALTDASAPVQPAR
jgi:hypothetical protein